MGHKERQLRLHTMPAKDFYWAKNTLTQRGIGPVSVTTVTLDASHMKEGDIAGLGLLNIPYEWIGIAIKPKSPACTTMIWVRTKL